MNNPYREEIQPGLLVIGNKYDLEITKLIKDPNVLTTPLYYNNMKFLGHDTKNMPRRRKKYILVFEDEQGNNKEIENTPQNKIYTTYTLKDQLKESKNPYALKAVDKATGGVEDLKKEIGKYGGKKRKSRKRGTIRKKRTRRRKGGNQESCPICMEEITPNERLTTSCNHNFHRQCFIQNCLAELNKENFETREEEDEVFQCPNCRGNTKEECLSDPEVAELYEEKKREYEDRMEQDSDEEDYPNMIPASRNEVFGNLQETLKNDLEDTISRINQDPNMREGEIDEFLTGLHSNLQEFEYELGSTELQYLNKMLDDIIDEKAIDLNLNLYDLQTEIKKEFDDFEQHQEGGKRRRRKQKGCKKKKSKKVKRKGGGIGSSKPTIPPIKESVNKTRKSISFSPSTKQPNSPKPNKKKEIFISKNKKKQKAVTQYENRQTEQDLRDMMLGKLPLKGGNKKKKRTKKRKGGTTTQGFGFKGLNFNKTTGNKYLKTNSETGKLEAHDEDCYGVGKLKWCKRK